MAASRDTDDAVRVEAIDPADWSISYVNGGKTQTLDPVTFADTYVIVEAEDFRVMRRFDPDGLAKRVQKDPAWVVVALCRMRGDKIDSDELEAILSPDLVEVGAWKKWWTRARTALKRVPQIRIEGRAPHYLTYDPGRDCVETQQQAEFDQSRDPLHRWTLVVKYTRECKLRKATPDAALLQHFHDRFEADAQRHIEAGAKIALRDALLAARSGALVGGVDPAARPAQLIEQSDYFVGAISWIDEPALTNLADACRNGYGPACWRVAFGERFR